jgi:uncharacterized protein (DUF736 family)|tara:strand:- start:836 stop:1054 length:219 start_codon:yes stop_codon:yes gene_type:complete
MAFEPKDKTGALFVNDNKKESKHPDYTGYVIWEGERINVAGWKSKSKDGKQSYLSLRCSEPQVKDSGDDLPF